MPLLRGFGLTAIQGRAFAGAWLGKHSDATRLPASLFGEDGTVLYKKQECQARVSHRASRKSVLEEGHTRASPK